MSSVPPGFSPSESAGHVGDPWSNRLVLKLRRAPGPVDQSGRPGAPDASGAGAAGARQHADAPTVSQAPRLDERQQEAVRQRGPVLRVLGAPGTGKTTTAMEVVVDRVRQDHLPLDGALILSPSRRSAAALRERMTVRLGGTSTEPLARTPAAFAFGILRQAAALRGDGPPRLLSGPEQDVLLRELLAGHAAGEGTLPQWPERVRPALATRGFRAELRELLMRAVERGLEPQRLAELGEQHGRPDWVAAAQVLHEYDEVTAVSRPGSYDPAAILGAAADLLEDDPEALDRLRRALRLVVVDDAQDLTPAAQRLLLTVVGPGTDLVLLGDPDAAVQTFRGADPHILGTHWSGFGDGPTVTLGTAYRLPAAMVAVSGRVAARIGAAGGVEHRTPRAVAPGGSVEVHLLRSAAQEAALVAATFRRAHLVDGVPWSQLAVVMRGQALMTTMRRVLLASGVPVSVPSVELPVRDEVAVRPLLILLELALRCAQGELSVADPVDARGGSSRTRPGPAEYQAVVDLLRSPIGGADAVSLRRLRRALRREELAAGGGRSSDELLTAAVLSPAGSSYLALLGHDGLAARRLARALAAGVEAARTVADGSDGSDGSGARRWAPGVTVETVLWAIWDSTGLGESWRRTALAGGTAGLRADRDLDAVLGLFDAAARYVDRLPSLGPAEFLEHIRSQDVAGDTLLARASGTDTVELLTPAAAAGRQWRRVVVAGVQEGVWPDLRLRGSLLGSEHLVDVLTGRGSTLRAAQAAVRYDETRLFLVAVTRASEQLLVSAVRSDEEQPSDYLDLVDPAAGAEDASLRSFTAVDRPLTLPSVVAQLRRELVRHADTDPGADTDTGADAGAGPHRDLAARRLARLATAGVPGADPSSWWAMTGLSDDRALRSDGRAVTVSPSKVEGYQRCGLRWLLVASGGDGPRHPASDIGTLVHDIAAELGDVDEATLQAEVSARWGRLGLPEGWLSRRQRTEAQAMVSRLVQYVASARRAGWERVGAELPMRVDLDFGTLTGRVDRLERGPGGALRVVDLKTGTGKPSAADLLRHPQLGAYQVALDRGAFAEHGSGSAGAALLQLGKAANKDVTLQSQRPLAQDEEPGWAQELLRGTAEGMSGGRFMATVGDWCRICPVRTSCPLQPEGEQI